MEETTRGLVGAVAAADAPKQSQVSKQFNFLEENVQNLESFITTLEKRLEPIVRPEPSNEKLSEGVPTQSGAPLADGLGMYNNRLAKCNSRLRQLNRTLEL